MEVNYSQIVYKNSPDKSTSSGIALPSLTPQMVNSLVEKKKRRVERCYEMARIDNPYFSGKMVVKVGIAGRRVDASVMKNELTPNLAACVVRAIKSIAPPPNDGQLVEIAKEYEFKISD